MGLLDFVKNTKIVKRIRFSSLFNPKSNRAMSPERLLLLQVAERQFNRWDVVVRLLAVEAHFGKNVFGWDLYSKMQELRQAEKNVSTTVNTYKKRFEELIESMKANGFDKEQPIITNAEGQLADGAHRLACALYFGVDQVQVKMAENWDSRFELAWFEQHFTATEVKLISARYQKIIESIDIKAVLEEIFASQSQNFGRGEFYQSSPALNISGQRPTQKRFDIYGLQEYIRPEHSVLDIGCNCGFFAVHMAQFVKEVDGIEINPALVDIGRAAANYLGLNNAQFQVGDFKSFKASRKYDLVFSFAVHYWIKQPIPLYAKNMAKLLNPGGILVFESQNLDTVDKDFDDKVGIFLQHGFTQLKAGGLKDDGKIERKFVLLRRE